MSSSAIDPVHRHLSNVLTPLIDDKMVALAKGNATKTDLDTVSTAEKYAAQVAYIQALNDVLDRCAEIENEMYGARPGAIEEEQQQG